MKKNLDLIRFFFHVQKIFQGMRLMRFILQLYNCTISVLFSNVVSAFILSFCMLGSICIYSLVLDSSSSSDMFWSSELIPLLSYLYPASFHHSGPGSDSTQLQPRTMFFLSSCYKVSRSCWLQIRLLCLCPLCCLTLVFLVTLIPLLGAIMSYLSFKKKHNFIIFSACVIQFVK